MSGLPTATSSNALRNAFRLPSLPPVCRGLSDTLPMRTGLGRGAAISSRDNIVPPDGSLRRPAQSQFNAHCSRAFRCRSFEGDLLPVAGRLDRISVVRVSYPLLGGILPVQTSHNAKLLVADSFGAVVGSQAIVASRLNRGCTVTPTPILGEDYRFRRSPTHWAVTGILRCPHSNEVEALPGEPRPASLVACPSVPNRRNR